MNKAQLGHYLKWLVHDWEDDNFWCIFHIIYLLATLILSIFAIFGSFSLSVIIKIYAGVYLTGFIFVQVRGRTILFQKICDNIGGFFEDCIKEAEGEKKEEKDD